MLSDVPVTFRTDDMDRFTRWRHQVLHRLLQIMVVLGGIAYVPSVWLAIRVEAWSVVFLDSAAYALVVGILAARRAPYGVRAGGVLFIMYAIGVGLLAALGPFNAGPYYILATPPMAAVFFGPRVTLGTFGAVAATVALIWQAGMLESPLLEPATGLAGVFGIVLSTNALFTTGLISLAITLLVQGLRISMAEAERSNRELRHERDRLADAHAELLRSVEEREEIELRLRHSEKLTAIGTMAGGIAHDFNNLLTPIVGGLELLRQPASTDDTSDDRADREILDDALRAAHRGRDLVARLLGFSRAEGEPTTELDLAQAVSEAFRLLRTSMPGNVMLEASLDPEAGRVMLSPTDIHQIVLNLGSNGYHAMGEQGGVLTVEVGGAAPALLPGTCDRTRLWCQISVADTGSGMDQETLRRAFEPFFTSKPLGAGTGLGLSSVDGIVRRAGGAVTIESEVGVGTTVRVFLPRVHADRSSEAEVSPLPARGAGQHVLLVDDEPSVRTAAARVLHRLGYRVTEAEHAAKAITMLERAQDPVDLVLSDVAMPGSSGTELAREVTLRFPSVAIVLFSGTIDEELRERARAVGCSHVTAKPFTVRDLGALLQDALAAGDAGSQSSS